MGGSSGEKGTGKQLLKRQFGASDVQNFLQRGNTLASKGKDIMSFKPTKKELFTETFTKRKTSFLGLQVDSVKTRDVRSGFLGEFAGEQFTQEKIDSLANRFLARQKEVQRMRGLAGKTQLFQERT